MQELNKFPSQFIASQFSPFIERKEINNIIESIAHTIAHKYAKKELVMIGLLKGSPIFLADLARKVHDVKIIVDFMKVGAYGRSKESQGTITIKQDISLDIRGKNVLIVKEIIDTGRALHFLKKHLEQSGPNSIEIATLFDKPYQRMVPISPEYIGKQLDDEFVVGYGMDLDQYGRNFEDVYSLQYPN